MKALNATAVKANSTVFDTRSRTVLCSRVTCLVSLALTLVSFSTIAPAPVGALEVKTPQLEARRASQRAAFLRQSSATVLTPEISPSAKAPTLASEPVPQAARAATASPAIKAPEIVNGLVVEQALIDAASKEAIAKADNEPATTGDALNTNLHDPMIVHEQHFDKAALTRAIPNFDLVNQHIWRGGAPGKAGVAKLAQNGVKTIIDLRMTGVGTMAEEADAKALGLNYVHIPMTFNCPPVNTVAQFMHVATNPLNQPVYVHCRQGADRTGTLIGIMRITQDHWSFRQAYSEMRQHHFKPWFGNLSKMVANYENNRQSQRQLAQATQAIQ